MRYIQPVSNPVDSLEERRFPVSDWVDSLIGSSGLLFGVSVLVLWVWFGKKKNWLSETWM